MKEPCLKKKDDVKGQRKYLVLAVTLVVILFCGSSYALLTNFDKTDEVVNISTGNLSVTINNTDELINHELNNKLPESDRDGLVNAAPITLTITNNGTLPIVKYEVKLLSDTDENKVTTLGYNYIKYAISLDGTNYSDAKTLQETNNIIHTGYDLSLNKSHTIYLRMWIDESAGNDALNKKFYGSISVDLYQKIDINKNNVIEYISNSQTIKIDNDVKFNGISSNGLFLRKTTVEDENPIYYFRGTIDNNNLLFAGYCWKIVRTTETGGTKLIYNGEPTIVDDEKQCLETSGDTTRLSVGAIPYNNTTTSPAYVGYSLPASEYIYTRTGRAVNNGVWYGKSVNKITFKLEDAVQTLDGDHHYSYNSTNKDATGLSGDTGKVVYYYGIESSGYYIKFDKTKTISTVLYEMLGNDTNKATNPSNVQGVINTWWSSSDALYGNYLEDAEWCNDRSIGDLGGWKTPGGVFTGGELVTYMTFNSKTQYDYRLDTSSVNIKNTNNPILTCENPSDRLTVANGNLTYKVGLLTTAEVALAGGTSYHKNTSFYLYTGKGFWLLSPNSYSSYDAWQDAVSGNGVITRGKVNSNLGVRPAVSLKPETRILRGDGSKEHPFVITE